MTAQSLRVAGSKEFCIGMLMPWPHSSFFQLELPDRVLLHVQLMFDALVSRDIGNQDETPRHVGREMKRHVLHPSFPLNRQCRSKSDHQYLHN